MQIATIVKFHEAERRVFTLAALAVRVAYPDPLRNDKNRAENEDARAEIAIRRLANRGEVWEHRHLVDAERYLEHMLEVCRTEAQVEHWMQFVQEVEPGEPVVGALFADPLGMIRVLVESRARFVTDIEAALVTLRAALAKSTPMPVYDPEGEDENEEDLVCP